MLWRSSGKIPHLIRGMLTLIWSYIHPSLMHMSKTTPIRRRKFVNCILCTTKFWNLLTLLKKCLRQHGPTESCQDELTSRQCSPRYVPWLWNREGTFKKKGQTELEIRESEFDNMHMAFIEKKGSFRSWVNSLNLWKWNFDGSPAWILWTQPQIPPQPQQVGTACCAKPRWCHESPLPAHAWIAAVAKGGKVDKGTYCKIL